MSDGKVSILMYHAVVRSPLSTPQYCFLDERTFRGQVQTLAKLAAPVSLAEALERMKSPARRAPCAVLTFDDGFQNNHDVVFPLLREAGIPATIFLTTGLVGSNDTPWFCRLHRALSKTRSTSIERFGHRLELSGTDARASASQILGRELKKLRQSALLAEVRDIIEELGDDPDASIEADSPFRMLDQESIVEMSASGLVEFGAHTHRHAILSRLTPAERREEIRRSVDAVGALTGRPCRYFAYPNGSAEDYDHETIEMVVDCGVEAAVTAIGGLNDASTPLMELRRSGVGAKTGESELRRLLGLPAEAGRGRPGTIA